MSNRQLGWDDQRIRDRLDPSEVVQGEQQDEQEAEAQYKGQPQQGDGWVPPGNKDQGSRK